MATQQITGRQIRDGAITNSHLSATADIASTKLASWSDDRDGNFYRLINLQDGIDANDAVTVQQMEEAILQSSAGLAIKDPVRVASTANVTGTYSATGGSSARGQFTSMPNLIDGVTLVNGDRVLLKNQTTAAQNGIWVVTIAGSGSNGTWDRATDADEDSEFTTGTAMLVNEGTANATTQWVLTTPEPITVGGSSGSALVFTQFGAGATYSAGTGLSLVGNQFNIANGGVGTTQLANGAVTNGKLGAGSVTGDKIAFLSPDVTGSINDSNVLFGLSNAPDPSSFIVWLNGLRQKPGTHYVLSGTNITFVDAPETGDDIAVFGVVVNEGAI